MDRPDPDGSGPDGPHPDGPHPDGPHPDGPCPDGPCPDRPCPERSRLTPGFWVLLVALILVLVAAVLIFLPFWGPFFLAAVTAMLLHPTHVRILRTIGQRRRALASAMTCVLFIGVVVVPLFWITARMVEQARGAIHSAASGLQVAVLKLSEDEEVQRWLDEHPGIREKKEDLLAVLTAVLGGRGDAPREPPLPTGDDLEEARGIDARDGIEDSEEVRDPDALEEAGGEEAPFLDLVGPDSRRTGLSGDSLIGMITNATKLASGVLRGAVGLAFKSAIFLFLLFFFLRDGPQLLASVRKGIPLREESQERVVRTFRDVVRSVLRGIFLTAMIQGTVAAVAYAILGKAAVFWGVVTAFCALVPGLGTAIVTIPMTLSLVLEERYLSAVFMLVVAGVVATMDNFIRPLLIKGQIHLHPVWILLSIMGGVLVFGPLGLVLGPMVIVLVRTLLKLLLETEGFLEEEPREAGSTG